MISKEIKIDTRPPAIKNRLEQDTHLARITTELAFFPWEKERVFYLYPEKTGVTIRPEGNQIVLTIVEPGRKGPTESKLIVNIHPKAGEPLIRSVDNQGKPDPYANHPKRVKKVLRIMKKAYHILTPSYYANLASFKEIITKEPVLFHLLSESIIDTLARDNPLGVTQDPRFQLLEERYPDWPSRFPALLDLLTPGELEATINRLYEKERIISNREDEMAKAIKERNKISFASVIIMVLANIILAKSGKTDIAVMNNEKTMAAMKVVLTAATTLALENVLITTIKLHADGKFVRQLLKIDESLRTLEERKKATRRNRSPLSW